MGDCNEQDKRDFTSSELGTKEYWDEVYKLELENYNESKDIGEIWFGESCQASVIRWIKNCEKIKKDSAIVDLGCGNGALLIELARQGFSCLTGFDYSENAITFAKTISAEENFNNIIFEVGDILNEESCLAFNHKYQVCHDKGTYDAISLMSDNFKQLQMSYIKVVKKILNEGGFFIITSCNWTKDQLLEQFSNDFHFNEVIPTSTFQFGGSTGSKYTTLVLIK